MHLAPANAAPLIYELQGQFPVSQIQGKTLWESGGREILHKIGGDDFQSFFRCNPQIEVVNNPLPVAQMKSCNTMIFSSGLLALVEDRSEFAFVIAHEVAHEMLGHLSYKSHHDSHYWTLRQEIDADLMALELIRKAGFQGNGAAQLLKRIGDFGADSGMRFAHVHPTIDKRRLRIAHELSKLPVTEKS